MRRRIINIRAVALTICLLLIGIASRVCAQDTIPIIPDSTFISIDDEFISSLNDSSVIIISQNDVIVSDKSSFKPNPKTAYRLALIFPGFGQAYNRQYWKLPIVYGGLMACAYAITWNNKTYRDYNRAYFDITIDSNNDPGAEHPEQWSQSWQDFIPGNIDPATRIHDAAFRSNLQRGKDYFRRYRDLSIIIGVAVYMICVADAYVDAQMFDFDVSPDLSFRFTPEFTPKSVANSHCYGFNVCMTF